MTDAHEAGEPASVAELTRRSRICGLQAARLWSARLQPRLARAQERGTPSGRA